VRNVGPEGAADLFLAPECGATGRGRARHHTSVVERGSFATALCACGWKGPARRARDRARLDAQDHAGD
jgi:hypothetical protein